MTSFQVRVQDQFTFAVGENGQHLSSTWMARCNFKDFGGHSEPEFFLFNLDAGDKAGKLSFHCSKPGGDPPQVFLRHDDGEGNWQTSGQWDWPDPLPGRVQLSRLAALLIPNSGLTPPRLRETRLQPTLLKPPPPGMQLEIDVFAQPEPFDPSAWPGRTALGTVCPGQFVYYDQDTGDARFRFVLVSRVEPENAELAAMATGGITHTGGENAQIDRMHDWTTPRAVVFLQPTVDGQELPTFAEIPIGPIGRPLDVPSTSDRLAPDIL